MAARGPCATVTAMTPTTTTTRPPLVVVAGGGVAALETCLALRAHLHPDELAIALLSPEQEFRLRPLEVLAPFDGPPAWRLPLRRFAADHGIRLIADAAAAVDVDAREVETAGGDRVAYDSLVVAVGARPEPAVPGAVTFRGAGDARGVHDAVESVARSAGTLAVVIPSGAFWPLPAYELALIARSQLDARDGQARVVLVTPELAPLEAFGPRASAAVAHLLAERGVAFVGGAVATAVAGGRVVVADGRRPAADAAVALPRLRGAPPLRLPSDPDGFVPVDEHGRVSGCPGVYAAGDITDSPLKQGGLATQQADAVAASILAGLGAHVVAEPFVPVLRGVLCTAAAPASPLWRPAGKIAGVHLSTYLQATARGAAPRAVPGSGGVEVEVRGPSPRPVATAGR
jgi:sulfide:quinone oxidoreductase